LIFAEKLKELRTAAGLTQTQLAENSGRGLGAIRDYGKERRGSGWALKALHQIAVIKTITREPPDDNNQMSSTDMTRLRQKTQKLEIPDKPVSTSSLQSVEAACRKFLAGRGIKFKWTGYGTKQVRK